MRAVFWAGEQSGGWVATAVFLGNKTNAPCALDGPIDFIGVSKAGESVTPRSACPRAGQDGCVAPAILPANAPFTGLGENYDPAQYAIVQINGFYRDEQGTPDGLCPPSHEVTPYTLHLRVGDLTFNVRNWATATGALKNGIHAVYGCHGRIGIQS